MPGDAVEPRPGPAVALDGVGLVRGGTPLLRDVSWTVGRGERWIVVGNNGAGKTTTIQIAAGLMFPTRGTATVLGHRMGRVDLRALRRHIGLVTTRQRLPDAEGDTAHTVVMTGHTGTVLPLWDRYDDEVARRADAWLDFLGCAYLRDRPIRLCSQGERARVRLARALLAAPALLVLDESFAGLDLPGREDLLRALESLHRSDPGLTSVQVTHHVEEIPATATHVLMLGGGVVTAAGPIESTLTEANLGACLGRPVRLGAADGRRSAHVRS